MSGGAEAFAHGRRDVGTVPDGEDGTIDEVRPGALFGQREWLVNGHEVVVGLRVIGCAAIVAVGVLFEAELLFEFFVARPIGQVLESIALPVIALLQDLMMPEVNWAMTSKLFEVVIELGSQMLPAGPRVRHTLALINNGPENLAC